MERAKQGLRWVAQEANRSGEAPLRGSDLSSDQAQVVFGRAASYSHRQVVSLWTCSKFCAISFIVGIFVGFTLKRRCRRWATKLLKRWKDD